jgi:guanylate kinase
MPAAKLIVISAPSGCGKTTIVQELLRRHPEFLFSISATTRSKRVNEIDGRDYFFLAKKDFEQKIARGELVEWEQIYGDYYGTLKSQVEQALRGNRPMLFDVDVKGAITIKKKYPEAVLIFVKPPSLEVLKERLMKRKTENQETLHKRLERVPMELEQEKFFDHSVVNDDLEVAVREVETIVGLNAKQ